MKYGLYTGEDSTDYLVRYGVQLLLIMFRTEEKYSICSIGSIRFLDTSAEASSCSCSLNGATIIVRRDGNISCSTYQDMSQTSVRPQRVINGDVIS